ncbi:hypothetical protein G7067_04645 [Leucobacter insecticola]|uniref:Uncharacterized protein n=1 Tax=Leucobacter insecticola TaxID=2714934 RepID=A0A6G8FHU4_9MICO|nr:DUF6541 family protein [Leucobacter insecticola]QIM15863.1 hypothetical protein G7067_04645 [Leucobacter insecticola]
MNLLTSWLPILPAVLVAIALVTVPGLPTAWALRLRGLPLVAGSIAASLAIIAITSLAAPFVGLSWGILPVLGTAVTLSLAALLLRRWLPRDSRERAPDRAWLVWALPVLVAGSIITIETVRAIASPENVSQTYDAVFHLNATAYILDTGDASPLHMNLAAPQLTTSIYPTLWHAIVALVSTLSGASIPVATNAVTLATAAWIWPVAVLFFATPFLAGRRSSMLFAAIFAATSSAFPYLLLSWGVLYPNVLATALVPVALGFTHLALRPQLQSVPAPRASLWVAGVGALGATGFAHPNGVYAFALILIPLLISYATRINRSVTQPLARATRWAAVLTALAVVVMMWTLVTNSDTEKDYGSSFLSGLVGALSNAPLIPAKAWFVTLFVLAGAVLLTVWKCHRWLMLAYCLTVVMYAVAIGLTGPLRDALTLAWYNDAARIAALLPITAVPLATVAATALSDAVRDGLPRFAKSFPTWVRRNWLPPLAVIAVAVILLTGARGANIGAQIGWMTGLFSTSPANNEDPDMLSADELALLERLSDEVPENARIAGDPWNGSAYAYAISGRKVVFPHMTAQYDADAAAIAGGLRTMGPQACDYLGRLGVDYVLDFGDPNFNTYPPEKSTHFSGLRHVSENPVLREVDRQGDAALFRVECDQ